jgi:hypothetical protein
MPRHSPGGLKARPAAQTGGCDAYASCGNHHGVGLLKISVAAGEAGPVLTRALSLLGVDQAIEIRDGINAAADPDH